jgi:Histidine phosphatase superfamily (branch 2)
VNELIARLMGIQPNSTLITNENSILDDSASTFPLNQTLNLDFTHDTNIANVITALRLAQFSQFLPTKGPPANQQLITSHMEPFAARLVLEKIECSAPIAENRTGAVKGNATTYMHLLLNQRTIPLGLSYEKCGNRSDGWCEYDAFLSTLQTLNDAANFTYVCYKDIGPLSYGNVTNGAPI